MLNSGASSSSDDQIFYDERIKNIDTLLKNHHKDFLNCKNIEERINLLSGIALVEDIELYKDDAPTIIHNYYPDVIEKEKHISLATDAKQIALKATVDAGLMYCLPSIYASQILSKTMTLCLAPMISPKWAQVAFLGASLGTWCFAPSYVPTELGKSLLNEGFERFGSSLYVAAPLASSVLFHYGNKVLQSYYPPVDDETINPDTPAKLAR